MLLRIERDVVRCLNWIDLGLNPCVCGSLGHAPAPKSTVEGLIGKRLKNCNHKRKALMGHEGSRLLFSFKHKLRVKALIVYIDDIVNRKG